VRGIIEKRLGGEKKVEGKLHEDVNKRSPTISPFQREKTGRGTVSRKVSGSVRGFPDLQKLGRKKCAHWQ